MWFSSLRTWWKQRTSKTNVHILLYTRQGCHLCETALAQLERARARYPCELELVDIDGDAELVRLHGTWVPVVAVNGKVRFRGQVNAVLLERLLRAETRRR